jgi:hypothetical protein
MVAVTTSVNSGGVRSSTFSTTVHPVGVNRSAPNRATTRRGAITGGIASDAARASGLTSEAR